MEPPSEESLAASSREAKLPLWYLNPIKAYALVKDFILKRVITRREAQIILIQFPYYSGTLPFYYDSQTDKFVLNRTFRGLFCWFLLLVISTISCIGITAAVTLKIATTPFQITNIHDVAPPFNLACYIAAIVLHWHTAFKRDDMVQLMNGYHQYVQFHKRKSGLHIHTSFAIIFFILICTLFSILFVYNFQ